MKYSDKRIVGLLAMFAASGLTCHCQSKGERQEWAESQIFELEKSDFYRANIIERANGIAKSHLREKFWGSWYWGVKGKQPGAYPSKPSIHSDHQWWVEYLAAGLKNGELPIRDLAELNVIGTDAVLRLIINGRQEVLVLAGKNPLNIASVGGNCEIVEYTIPNKCFGPVLAPSEEALLKNHACVSNSLTVCMKCTSVSDAVLILESTNRILATLPPNIDVTLALREDEFFFDVPLFPVLGAFNFNSTLDLKKLQALRRSPSKVLILNSGHAAASKTKE